MLIVFDWEMMGSDEIKIKEWIKEWKELGPWEEVRGWETIGFSRVNEGQKWKSRKMKSEKVRIFFPDGLKRLSRAWEWRKWLFYALAYWILTEFTGLSGHLEILLEEIVLFRCVRTKKNNCKWKFYPTFVLQKPENKEKPAPWCSTLGCAWETGGGGDTPGSPTSAAAPGGGGFPVDQRERVGGVSLRGCQSNGRKESSCGFQMKRCWNQ